MAYVVEYASLKLSLRNWAPARLICTYRGTSTQYGLANTAGDPETVHTVPTGTAIVLRGKR